MTELSILSIFEDRVWAKKGLHTNVAHSLILLIILNIYFFLMLVLVCCMWTYYQYIQYLGIYVVFAVHLMFCFLGLLRSNSHFRLITLVVCDSRGGSLLPYITDDDVHLKFYRGARLMFVAHRASELIGCLALTSVLIAAGINDMTFRDKTTRVIKVRLEDSFDLANFVIRQIIMARAMLTRRHPGVKLAFGGINGIQLNRYNVLEGYSDSQGIIDEAIIQVNAYIRLLNQNAKVYPPRLTSKVHTWYKGRNKNNYHLLRDGLHLGHIVTRYWLRSIKRFHKVNTLGLAPLWIRATGTCVQPSDHELCRQLEHS